MPVGLVPVCYALTGPIAHAIGPDVTLTLAGTSAAPTMIAFLALPGIRNLERGER